jgi:hypothetical protein
VARTDARSDHAVLDLLVLFDQAKRTVKKFYLKYCFTQKAENLSFQFVFYTSGNEMQPKTSNDPFP